MHSALVVRFATPIDKSKFLDRYRQIVPSEGAYLVPPPILDGPIQPMCGFEIEGTYLEEVNNKTVLFDIVDEWTNNFLICLVKEIIKRHQVEVVGWDSPIYTPEEFMEFGCFEVRRYEIQSGDGPATELDDLDAIEKKYQDAATEFFEAAHAILDLAWIPPIDQDPS